jgi:hypothetical protein
MGAKAESLKDIDRLVQRRNALPAKRGIESSSGVESLQFDKIMVRNTTLPVGGARKTLIVEQHRLAVTAETDVELYPSDSQFGGSAERCQRVLRRVSGDPPMPNKRSDTSGFHATGSDLMFNQFRYRSHNLSQLRSAKSAQCPAECKT